MPEDDVDLQNVRLAAVLQLRASVKTTQLERLESLPSFQKLFDRFTTFWQNDNGPMSHFWSSYIDLATLLLAFIRATREGNWQLHLDCVQTMIPYTFSYDRTNYSRYLPVYWRDMVDLPLSHPAAHDLLESGPFTVQRSNGNTFGQVAVDMTIEQTLNRKTKTRGGIVGFSLKPGVVERWFVTAHDRALQSPIVVLTSPG